MYYIVVTGGVISGLGKGITASSIGLLLKGRGFNVTAIKIDPYLNIDAGTMSPYEHGEVYVLADGGEVDLDLGNYERFLDIELTKDHNITTGKIYMAVLNKERNGDYLGQTVQVVPHITNEIIRCITETSKENVTHEFTYDLQYHIDSKEPDICIIEVGGTVGDIENRHFIEAIRQMSKLKGNKFCFVHVSPLLDNGELKTKPTQQNLSIIRSLGICPDILVLRTPRYPSDSIINKLSLMGQIEKQNIICNVDVPNIYYVPDLFIEQKIMTKISKVLDLKPRYEKIMTNTLTNYNKILRHYDNNLPTVKIGIAGKYTGSQDTYLTLIRAICHACFKVKLHYKIVWINTEQLDMSLLKFCDVVVIPGGFGSRGVEGKISVATFCRANKVPMLGICLGMQIMVVEKLRSVGLVGASSTEWDKNTEYPVVDILPGQTGIKGGTMRLGNYTTTLEKGSKTLSLYKRKMIVERHRHRYEINSKFLSKLDNLHIAGKGLNNLIEIVELDDHPFYIGCQFHPEYSSHSTRPHPLFVGLLQTFQT